MILTVFIKPSKNCFVALPPHIVAQIFQQLDFLSNSASSLVALQLSWEDIDAKESGKSNSRRYCFVGWAGESSTTGVSIEVSSNLAECLRLYSGQQVDVIPIHNVTKATSVCVEPVSSDDWEIVELHAEYLEEQLLNQISVVYIGEIFPLWIRQQTVVNLKIVSIDPSGNTPCAQLTHGTEVIISPKPRDKKPQDSKISTVFSPGRENISNMKISSQMLRIHYFPQSEIEIPFNSVYISRKDIESFKEWKEGDIVQISTHLKADGSLNIKKQECYAKLAVSENIPIDHLLAPPYFWKQFEVEQFSRLKVQPISSLQVKKLESLEVVEILDENEKSSEYELLTRSVREWAHTNCSILSKYIPVSTTSIAIVKILEEPPYYRKLKIKFKTQGTTEESNNNSTEKLDFFIMDASEIAHCSITLAKQEKLEANENLSEVQLSDIGGISSQLEIIKKHLLTIYSFPYQFLRKQINIQEPGGILLTGPHGCGKTMVAQAMANFLKNEKNCLVSLIGSDISHFSCSETTEGKIDSIKSKIQRIFQTAIANRPSIVLLDDIDLLAQSSDEGQEDLRASILAEYLLDVFNQTHRYCQAFQRSNPNRNSSVSVIATCQNSANLHYVLRTSNVFGKIIEISSPDLAGRVQILQKLIKKGSNRSSILAHSSEFINNLESLNKVATNTEGYLGSDLLQLIERAVHVSSVRFINDSMLSSIPPRAPRLSLDDFNEAQKDFVPISLKGIHLHSSDVEWKDIGGLDEVRRILKETLEWPTKYPSLFKNIPLRPRSGLMLYGPPGCGKTLLASAVAKECGLNFISIKGPELLNKYIGASEQSVRDLFRKATQAKPCVLFFDEFDSIAPRRGHDTTGVTDRVVNQLLTQLDGVEALQGVYVLAATSRPDLIDPALLRPGRLDKCLYCGFPSMKEREEIMKAVSRKLRISPEISLEELSKETENYTGADLQALMYNCQLEAIHDTIDTKSMSSKAFEDPTAKKNRVNIFKLGNSENSPNQIEQTNEIIETLDTLQKLHPESGYEMKEEKAPEQALVTADHVKRALLNSRPSVSSKERRQYEMIYNDFLRSRGDFEVSQPKGQRQTLA